MQDNRALSTAMEATTEVCRPVTGSSEVPMQDDRKSLRRSSRQRRRGSEMVEFTLALLPLLMIMFTMIDISWSIFVKATLQYAVHMGLRQGITITGTQATTAGKTLTQIVKGTVQSQSLGILRGADGLSYIHVNFFAVDTTTKALVSANASARQHRAVCRQRSIGSIGRQMP